MNRKDLLKIKGFGKKTFENAAGFLRVRNGIEKLGNDKYILYYKIFIIL